MDTASQIDPVAAQEFRDFCARRRKEKAAPDMLEALRRAEITIAQHIRTPPGGGLHEMSAEEISALVDAHPTIKLIRAAIAKAEGR